MKNKKPAPKKPARKYNKVLLVFALFFTVVAVWVLFAILKNNYQRKKVSGAMDVTQKTLKDNGFTGITRRSGCGRTQVKYGKGAVVCTTALKFSEDVKAQSANGNDTVLKFVNNRIKSFYESIESTGLFKRSGDIPVAHLPGEGFSFGDRYHELTSSGSRCNASFDISWKEYVLAYSLFCIDTDWFNNTFRSGQFEF